MARAAADQVARDLVERHVEQLEKWDEDGREVRKRLADANSNEAKRLNQILIGFRSLKDENAFLSFSGRDDYAKQVTHRVLHGEPLVVRQNAVHAVKERIGKESDLAKAGFQKTYVKRVMWVNRSQKDQGVVRDDVIQGVSSQERREMIADAVANTLAQKHPELASIIGTAEARWLIEQHAEDLYEHIKAVPPPALLKRLDGILANLELGAGGLPSKAELDALSTDQERLNLAKAGIHARVLDVIPSIDVYKNHKDVSDQIDSAAKHLLGKAGGPEGPTRVASTSRQTPQPGITIPSPGRPVLPEPRQVVEAPSTTPTAKGPPTLPAIELHLRLIFEASDNSDRCTVMINGEGLDLTETVTRATKSRMLEDIKRVHRKLDEELPTVIFAAFKKTQGRTARFNVAIETNGAMAPLAAARELAKLSRDLFIEVQKDNNLVQPSFTTWISDQPGMGGHIESLLESGG